MDLTNITKGTASTVAELIDLCEKLEEKPFDGRVSGNWAYRGQPKEFGALTPSFQRHFPRKSRATAELIEEKLIAAFRHHYSKLSDRTPRMPDPQLIGDGYDLRCLSLMQHYEIPTRLLDWTTDFWTAIYFACASDPGSNAELWFYGRRMFDWQRSQYSELESLVDPSSTPITEPKICQRYTIDDIVVEVDTKTSPRMREQHAHHTVSSDVFSDHAEMLVIMERTYQSESKAAAPPRSLLRDAPLVQRWLIDARCKSHALRFLAEQLDITASTIFPDFVGLGRFLRWQFDSLCTMYYGITK